MVFLSAREVTLALETLLRLILIIHNNDTCKWKIPPKLREKFYKTVVRPYVVRLYGSECWPMNQAQLKRVQLTDGNADVKISSRSEEARYLKENRREKTEMAGTSSR